MKDLLSSMAASRRRKLALGAIPRPWCRRRCERCPRGRTTCARRSGRRRKGHDDRVIAFSRYLCTYARPRPPEVIDAELKEAFAVCRRRDGLSRRRVERPHYPRDRHASTALICSPCPAKQRSAAAGDPHAVHFFGGTGTTAAMDVVNREIGVYSRSWRRSDGSRR